MGSSGFCFLVKESLQLLRTITMARRLGVTNGVENANGSGWTKTLRAGSCTAIKNLISRHAALAPGLVKLDGLVAFAPPAGDRRHLSRFSAAVRLYAKT